MAALLALAVAIGAVAALTPLPDAAAPTAGSATGIEQGIAAKNHVRRSRARRPWNATSADNVAAGVGAKNAGPAPIVHSGGGWNPGRGRGPVPRARLSADRHRGRGDQRR